jgi:hypothetical protein
VTLGGNSSEDYVALPPLDITTNTITVTAWIKPDGIQPDYSSIFMHDGATAGFKLLSGLQPAWLPLAQRCLVVEQWSDGPCRTVEPCGNGPLIPQVPTYMSMEKGRSIISPFLRSTSTSGNRLGNYKGWGGRFVKGTIRRSVRLQ